MEQDQPALPPQKKNLALSQVYAGFCGASITITNGPSFEPETTEKGLKKAHKETLSFFIKKHRTKCSRDNERIPSQGRKLQIFIP